MANTTGPITRLPIWRYRQPLVSDAPPTLNAISGADAATATDAASVVVLAQPGYFASQFEDLPGPRYYYRPYLWHRGALLSPGAGSLGSGLISAADLAAAAEDASAILLDNLATETGADADAATNVLLASTATETGTGTESATNILLATPSDAGAGADASPNISVGGADEAAVATDGATVFSLPQPGFFGSEGWKQGDYGDEIPGPAHRQRPYWRYDGPLLAAAPPGVPVAVSASDGATATEAAANVLLGSAGEVGEASGAADAISGVALSTAADAGAGSEGVTSVTLAGAGDAGGGLDAALNILLTGIGEAGVGVDSGSMLDVTPVVAQPGFFASLVRPGPANRQRPIWRYRGPLLAASILTVKDISVVSGDPRSGWLLDTPSGRWFIIFGDLRSGWVEERARVEEPV